MGTPQIPSVDSDTKQFPDMVRAVGASNLSDPMQVEGAALRTTVAGHAVSLPAGRDYVTGAQNGTRRLVLTTGDCNTTAAATSRDFFQRTVIRFPRRVKRMRVRVANRNLLTGAAMTTPMTFGPLYVGTPAYDTTGNRRWNGSFTAAPTLLLPGTFNIPTDGTDWVSDWVTLPDALQETNVLISYAMTTAASGSGVGISGNGDALRGGAGSSGQAGYLTTSGGSYDLGKIFGDIRFEYEVDNGVRVGIFVGDSITAGAANSSTASPPEQDARVGILGYERWPDVAARAGNFCAINLGVGSIGSDGFSSPTAQTFTRATIGTSSTVPDFAVIASGTNDLPFGLATVQSRIAAVIASVRALGVPQVYLATLLPKGLTQFTGTLAAAATVGATTITSSVNIAAGVPCVIDNGSDYEVVTVTGSTGTGPFTLTVNALTKAHSAGVAVLAADEATRARYNAWVRSLPLGIMGVIDFDLLMASAPDSAVANRNLMFGDFVHPHRGGAARMGLYAAQLGRV